jgi:hypothetical protein
VQFLAGDWTNIWFLQRRNDTTAGFMPGRCVFGSMRKMTQLSAKIQRQWQRSDCRFHLCSFHSHPAGFSPPKVFCAKSAHVHRRMRNSCAPMRLFEAENALKGCGTSIAPAPERQAAGLCLRSTIKHQRTDSMKLNTFSRALPVAVVAFALSFGASHASAQAERQRGGDRGNFDPAEMRQRMMERMREQFEVKNDDEWKVIEGRISKVMDAQRDARMGMGFGGFRGGPGAPGGRRGGSEDANRRSPFGGEPSPEAESLQKAIEAKASADELKTKLAKYREVRKAKEAALEKAQDDLRKVLSARQEAIAVTTGLLK